MRIIAFDSKKRIQQNIRPFTNNSKDVLEKSRLFSLALDKASELGGSVKFFEPSNQNWFELFSKIKEIMQYIKLLEVYYLLVWK